MTNRSRKTLLLVVTASVISSGCGLFMTRKPWRTYDEIPFDSQKWREGDEIERGRMSRNLRDQVDGKTEAAVLEMLGKPDEIENRDNTKYLIYNTEHPGRRTYFRTPISFDKNGKARLGTSR